jgi:hypothetical protein
MKKKVHVSSVLLVMFSLCFSWGSAVSAYEGIEVEDGGSITGNVTLNGPVPEPRVFPIVLYPFGSYCKKISNGNGHVLLKEFNVDAGGGLQDAVVAVQDVKRGKRFQYRENQLVTVNCMFHPSDVPESEQFELHGGKLVHVHPLVDVMRNHRLLYAINKDPIVHGAQVYQKETGHRVLSFPIAVSNDLFGGYVHLNQGKRIVQIICPMHEYMQTWGWIVDNPYYAKTEKGGGYKIDRLLPGRYKVTAWHPHMKPIEKEVAVPPNGTVSVNFQFDSRQVVRPIYETQEHFRIRPESNPHEDLKGCEGSFCVMKESHHQR